MSFKRILYKTLFLGITILIVPAVPILIIFLGISSPKYIIYGTLNMDVSHSLSAWEIYVSFLKNIIVFNFGISTSSGQPVINELMGALLESLKSIVIALFVSYTLGTIVGFLSQSSERLKKFLTKTEFIFYIPMIVFSYIFLYFLDFMGIDFLSNIRYLISGLILSIFPFYIITKSINKTVIEIKNSEYFSLHRAYGFNDELIWKKFCAQFIVIDYLSFFENILLFMFGFIFFVEIPFGIYGIGYKFVIAIQRFDYPVIIGFCIFSIILFSVIGVLTETTRMIIDPRGVNE